VNRLEARSLTKRYGNVEALSRVSVDVQGSAILCVAGPSGGGKSTLLRQLHLLEPPDEGEIRIDGVAPASTGRPRRESLRRFALVQQRPGLLRASVRDNVAFPLVARGVGREQARDEAARWLGLLGLEARLRAEPSGLSGGEAQRVALARALCTRPDFLLLDEGTNQLDPHAVRRVESVIREEAERGCAVVLVTHNIPQMLRMADAFVFLEDGKVAEAGRRDQLDRPRTEALRFFLETGS
jgi:ABC-type polar amino acid transport system ATPase subunit